MQADHQAFLALVGALRALGAVRIRDGALEASFAGAVAAEEPAGPAPKRHALGKSEREELEELRAQLARNEELG